MSSSSEKPRLHHFQAMGGPCDLAVFGGSDRLFGDLQAEVIRLESRYSRYRSDSLISTINQAAGEVTFVDEECAGLLNYADHCYRLSDGVFDITSGALRRAWNFHRRQLPDPVTLAEARACIGWDRVEWDGERLRLEPAMELDLGGVVKEFAADRLVTLMKEAGSAGMANLAGDIAITGLQPNGQPWVLGIRDPLGGTGPLAKVALDQGGLASSGDYERGFMLDGVRYSHILDPRTGWPVSKTPRSVSVIADHCIMAGTLATIAMLKGKDAESWLVEMELPFLLCKSSGSVSGTLLRRDDNSTISQG
jgi:thiamine biosynthesis lipoprotein